MIYVAADDRSVRVWTPIATPSWRRCAGWGRHATRRRPGGEEGIRCAAVCQRQRKDPALAAGVVPLARFDVKGSVRAVAFDTTGGRVPAATPTGCVRAGWAADRRWHCTVRHWAAAACSAATAPCSRSAPRAPCGSARSTAAGRCASGTGGHQLELQPRRNSAAHDARRRHRRIWRTDRAAGALHELKAAKGRGVPLRVLHRRRDPGHRRPRRAARVRRVFRAADLHPPGHRRNAGGLGLRRTSRCRGRGRLVSRCESASLVRDGHRAPE